jgi:hypothetical protein
VTSSPQHEYQTRKDARRAARDALTAADARLAHARLATFAAGVAMALLAWRYPGAGFWWLLAPIAGFVWLARRHADVVAERDLAIGGIAFYERGLARIEDRWIGTGEPGDRFRDDHHVYANDFDLFGRGSLFELLSVARTRTGEATLARWLTSPASVPEIMTRQAAVDELAPKLDFRERLALTDAHIRASVDTDRVVAWAESPTPSRRTLAAAIWLCTGATGLGILHLAFTLNFWPISTLLIVEAIVLQRFREDIASILSTESQTQGALVAGELANRVRDLTIVASVLRLIERASFENGYLISLQNRLVIDEMPSSAIIRRLCQLSETYDSQRQAAIVPAGLILLGAFTSQVWWIALGVSLSGLLMLVRPHVALAVERWRSRFGRRVRVWIDTIAELEALNSLAGYRYEQHDGTFPDFVSPAPGKSTPAVFDGIQLGHPLLPRATMVPNDVRLVDGMGLLIVTGSNMSGKSTLLRTVGINAVLALAGAPVRASSLRLSPLAIGATLRIQDSLLEGRSRFYAEATRIRAIVEIASGPVPALFLLDELFHGTNSHDRLVAAGGVLRSLLDRGAIGLMTTHDLALTAIADDLAPRARNMHFQDLFEENGITFDYRARPGPVTRSNALALLRSLGLDVAVPAAREA